jgi:molybdenum cofactor cytidylyltransferase
MATIIAQARERARRAARTTAVVVVAAGASRRLGRPKQLVRRAGVSLLLRTVTDALAFRPLTVVVVLGARASRLAAELRGVDARIVVARGWRGGLANSLATGIRAAPRAARHCLVLTVDQWRVGRRGLGALLKAAGHAPAAAWYADGAAVPAIFPARYRRRLTALRGDRGARALLTGADVRLVPMPEAAEDLDTPEALRRFRQAGPRR